MTNAEIILTNSIFLMEQGILKPTAQKITITDDQGKREVFMPEPIHTYKAWAKLGYQVKRGEHAVAKFPVWKFKPAKGKEDEEAGEEEQKNGRCFMKVAFFFTADQVKPKEGV